LAETRAEAEERARRQANAETAKATAMSNLMQQMFQSVSPERGRGEKYSVHDLLGDFSNRLANELSVPPETEAALRATIGDAFTYMNDYEEAEYELRTALSLRELAFGRDSAEVADILGRLAYCQQESGDPKEGEETARRALATYDRLGLVDQAAVRTMWVLQLSLSLQQRYKEAIKVGESSLQVSRSQSPLPPYMASILHQLAIDHTRLGNLELGEKLGRESIAMHIKLHGPDHFETGWGYFVFATILAHEKKHEEAEEFYRKALAFFRVRFGDTYKGVRWSVGGLASVLEAQGNQAALAQLISEMTPSQETQRTGEFAVSTGDFPVEAARGKHVSFSGWVKTANVDQYAGLWWRVDGPNGQVLAFDNMHDRGPRGTSDWTQFTIELDVPQEVTSINYGTLMPGKGQAWFDGLEVRIDGQMYVSEEVDFDFESDDPKGFWIRPRRSYRTELDNQAARSGRQSMRMESVDANGNLDVNVLVEIEPKLLEQFVGTYKHSSGLEFAVTAEANQLWVRITGQGKIEVYAKSSTRFFYRIVNAEIEFYRNEAGQVDGLTLFQNGKEYPAAKVVEGEAAEEGN
jgi:tetratricopeptide (TPR) repeat protein